MASAVLGLGLAAPTLAHAEEEAPVPAGAQVAQAAPANNTNAASPNQTGGANVGTGSAVTQGGTAPAAQADQPAEEPKKAPSLNFYDHIAGSSLFVQTGATIGTFFKGYQADYNPTVQTFASFRPRWTINKEWQIRGIFSGQIEYTNSDVTNTQGEPELYDGTLQLFYRGIPAIGGRLKLMPAVTLGMPLSKGSRARTLIAAPGLNLQAVTGFDHVLGGDLMFIAFSSYQRPIYRYTTPGTLDDRPYALNCAGDPSSCGNQLSGVMNARDSFTNALIAVGEWGDWSPGLFFGLQNQIAYTPKRVEGISPTLANGQEPSTSRTSSFFYAWIDYHLNEWVTPELGYQQIRSLRAADGSFGNPFFSNKQQQILYFAFNIQFDSLIRKLAGEEAQGGVVRAKNTMPVQFY